MNAAPELPNLLELQLGGTEEGLRWNAGSLMQEREASVAPYKR